MKKLLSNPFVPAKSRTENLLLKGKKKQKLRGGILFIIGYILSPFSWWNDVVINLPFSYLVANIVSYFLSGTFEWVFILWYWITNLVGLFLMHLGQNDFFNKKFKPRKVWQVVIITLIYSFGIIILTRTKIVIPVIN